MRTRRSAGPPSTAAYAPCFRTFLLPTRHADAGRRPVDRAWGWPWAWVSRHGTPTAWGACGGGAWVGCHGTPHCVEGLFALRRRSLGRHAVVQRQQVRHVDLLDQPVERDAR
jgi:hypothetical protein